MEAFKIKNGISATRYLGSNGTETAGSDAYSLTAASYDSVSFNISGQAASAYNLLFNSSGTKMYIVDAGNDNLYQYSLSTAFDLSTTSYDSVSFSIASQDTSPTAATFNSDGTKLYVVGISTDTVYQYSLSTAFDLSTASYDSVSFSVASQDTFPTGIVFNSSGTNLYIAGPSADSVFQYSLSTAFDLSSTSYNSVSLDVSGQDSAIHGLVFNSDGTKLYVLGSSSDTVYQYSLSTAFDLSTASYNSVSFSVQAQDNSPAGIAFNSDGTKMYYLGFTGDSVYQYSTVGYTQALDLSTGTTFSFTPSGSTTVSFTNPPTTGIAIGFSVEIVGDASVITWPSSIKWHLATAPTATATKELYTFVTTDGGTTYYGKKAAEGIS